MTTYGADIDSFIATYIPESKKELARLELQVIVIKAMKAQLFLLNPSTPSK